MFTHALYYLAAYPEHAAALREEVERVVREEGWSKASLGNMQLVDDFLKEVLRVTGLGASKLPLSPSICTALTLVRQSG